MRLESSQCLFSPFLLVAIFLSALPAQAQQMPQPAPELKKLDSFVGTWKTDADLKATAMSPAGKITGTDRVEWMDGKFFLLIHSTFTGAGMGSGVEVAVMGYDSSRRVYTYESYNSFGEHESGTGTVEGNTWVWTSDPSSRMKWRFTEKVVSPALYNMKFEISSGGTTWSTVMEGKATKQ